MDPGIQFADLLAYNTDENDHWKRWLAEHVAALDLPCDVPPLTALDLEASWSRRDA